MDVVEILAGALVAIVTSAVTAYITVRLQSRAERSKWDREIAVKYSALRMRDPQAAVRLATDTGQAALVVVHADGTRDKHPIPKMGTLLIGREQECDISVCGDDISGLHARVHSEGNCIYIEDVKSTNGVLLNGRQIDRRARLVNGDTFQIGSTTFEMVIW